MIRSSSDSSYNPRSSCGNGLLYQLTNGQGKEHHLDVAITQPPGSRHSFSEMSLRNESSPSASQGAGPLSPHRTKKCTEILVRKPRSFKPKPPPRKYFKQDCPDNEQMIREMKERPNLHENEVPPSSNTQVRQASGGQKGLKNANNREKQLRKNSCYPLMHKGQVVSSRSREFKTDFVSPQQTSVNSTAPQNQREPL